MNLAANPPVELWPAPITSAERICDVLSVYAPSLARKYRGWQIDTAAIS